MDYKFLLDIGLIILVVKIFNIITKKVHVPRILGGLLAGILLGPAVFNIVQTSDTLEVFSTLGIVFIMFLAGMETKLKSFMHDWKKYFVIAIIGIFTSLVIGTLISLIYVRDININLLVGIFITSTSVTITVEALLQLRKLHTKAGMAILGAGVVDDIIGVVFLAIIMNGGNFNIINVGLTISQMIIFFCLAAVVGFIAFKIFEWLERSTSNAERLPTFSLAFALIMAFLGEHMGASGLIGAYIAGLVIGNTEKGLAIKPKIEMIVFLVFAPIFFASIGLKLETLNFPISTWIFILIFTIAAIISKLIGNGIGAKLSGYNKNDSIRIGIGMATRGELALIMLGESLMLNLISNELFSVMLVSIILITIITPILLQISLKRIAAEPEPKNEENESY